MSEEKRITLRLPEDLHSAIVAESERNKTSLNGEIVIRLRRSFGNDRRIADLEDRIAVLESER